MANSTPKRHDTTDALRERMNELNKLANGGDKCAMTELRLTLDSHPEIWRAMGDIARGAELAVAKQIAGNDSLLLEALQRKAEELRQELGGPDPSPAESLAVSQAVLSWMHLQYLQLKYAGVDAAPGLAKTISQLKQAAQKNFDSALKSVLLIREKMPGILRAQRPKLKVRRTG